MADGAELLIDGQRVRPGLLLGRDSGRFVLLRDAPQVVTLSVMRKVEWELVKASPVDTARFRASWIASKDTPSELDPISKQQQLEYRASGRKFWRRTAFMGEVAWRGASRNSEIYLTNNVPYAGVLRDQGSRTVPPGWAEAAIRKGTRLGTFARLRQFFSRITGKR